MGKPPIKLPAIPDPEKIVALAAIGCTVEEIATVLGVKRNTVHVSYQEYLDRGHAQQRVSLRKRQWKKGMEGDVSMLRWLGIQYLGQKNQVEVEQHGDMALDGQVAVDVAEIRSVIQNDEGFLEYLRYRACQGNGHARIVGGYGESGALADGSTPCCDRPEARRNGNGQCEKT
jgi:hypothetical protein